MALFRIESDKQLKSVKEDTFKLERDIQTLVERNLELLFGLIFVKSEFKINNYRVDTLAFDLETGTFVIIEYKRDKNFSVIDQGFAYLSLMLNNKSDFILEYNENSKNTLKRGDVDWSQSRIIFVSPFFTTYQKEAINFKDLPIELWEIKRYENGIVNLHQIKAYTATESIKAIGKQNHVIENVSEQIKIYTEDEHLSGASDSTKELYEIVKNAVLNLDDLEIKPKKKYIAFVAGTNVLDIHIQKNALKIWINMLKGDLEDPKGIARDVSSVGHWGNGDYEISFQNEELVEYLLTLIRQSLKKNKK